MHETLEECIGQLWGKTLKCKSIYEKRRSTGKHEKMLESMTNIKKHERE